jgi:hypothetical protein
MRNLAQLLADRLIVANAKVDILTSMQALLPRPALAGRGSG